MKLSKNFSLKELTKSKTAMRHGIDNNPNKEQMIPKIKQEKGEIYPLGIARSLVRSIFKSDLYSIA